MNQPITNAQPDLPGKGAIVAFYDDNEDISGHGRIVAGWRNDADVQRFSDGLTILVPYGNMQRIVIARSDVYGILKSKSPPRHPALRARIARHIGVV